MDQYLDEIMTQHEADGVDELPQQKRKSALAAAAASDDSNGCFDCNICLENALDPVVTLCGHLYCWPCIYKWFHFQNDGSTSPQQQQQCPVCKACISQTTLVPLYGRGQSSPHTHFKGKKPFPPTLDVPRRPSACGVHSLATTSPRLNRRRHPRDYNNYNLEETSPLSMPLTPRGLHPLGGMFGEMIYGRVFGNSESEERLYRYPNSYARMGSSSPRVRRQEMHAVRSLNRVSIFLFCFVIFCLLLF